jgi:hypothetical protein
MRKLYVHHADILDHDPTSRHVGIYMADEVEPIRARIAELEKLLAQIRAKAEEALSEWEACDTRSGLRALIGLMDSVNK